MTGLKIKEDVMQGIVQVIQPDTNHEMTYFPVKDLSLFFKWLKHYPEGLNYISVPMRECYSEMIYILRPQTLIIIEPDTISNNLKEVFGEDVLRYMEETAATNIDEEMPLMSWDMPHFLKRFYNAPTRKEALEIYNHWQEVIPLNNIYFCKVLEIFEEHLDEILNYFSLQEKVARDA
ncbi:hypothetical protein PBV87_03955 [Niameybacter massiliensis]|uniref:Uncharacterized protein n=1 Tax=Holtiella tumoricola TaxID=3018743 RepID=A0AA42IZQ5_9FIRM|nr:MULTISPECIES: hypothetical protein [Lachnospirales]MDA3730652.1 hypothetical protein [Holtiella tumoricola]